MSKNKTQIEDVREQKDKNMQESLPAENVNAQDQTHEPEGALVQEDMQEKEKDSRDGKLKEKKLTSIKEKVMNQKGSWIGTNVEWTE